MKPIFEIGTEWMNDSKKVIGIFFQSMIAIKKKKSEMIKQKNSCLSFICLAFILVGFLRDTPPRPKERQRKARLEEERPKEASKKPSETSAP